MILLVAIIQLNTDYRSPSIIFIYVIWMKWQKIVINVMLSDHLFWICIGVKCISFIVLALRCTQAKILWFLFWHRSRSPLFITITYTITSWIKCYTDPFIQWDNYNYTTICMDVVIVLIINESMAKTICAINCL